MQEADVKWHQAVVLGHKCLEVVGLLRILAREGVAVIGSQSLKLDISLLLWCYEVFQEREFLGVYDGA